MILLALDPNTKATGYVLYDDPDVLLCGTLETPVRKGVSLEMRMQHQRTMLEGIIGSYKPDFVIVEDTFVGPNVRGALDLTWIAGILVGGLCDNFRRMGNREWWKIVTGSGKRDYDSSIKGAWKGSVAFKKAKKFLGCGPNTEHEMDATCILIAYLDGSK